MNIIIKDNVNVNINLSDNVFNYPLNMSLIHQVITSYRINSRKGTSSQKSRSEVSGSNKKPWKQKGTGRARAGSVKSPIWRSGGVTFAAKPVKYFLKVNKKMYRNALKSILSELIRQSRLYVFSDFILNKPKTSFLLKKLRGLNFNDSLIIVESLDNNLYLASRNLYKIFICCVNNINIVNLLKFKNILFTIDSIKNIEDKLK